MLFVKNPHNIHRKTLALKSPLKVARREACNFIKRDSNVDTFLWMLQNF